MKKMILSATLASSIMLGGAISTFAAEDAIEHSTGTVTLTKTTPTEPVDPGIDPTDPEKPNPPKDPAGPTGEIGDLTIDVVPQFDFVKDDANDGMKGTFNMTTYDYNYLQVSDQRATGDGWSVGLATTPFTLDTDQTIKLQNAEVTIPFKAYEGTTATATPATIDTSVGFTNAGVFAAGINEGMGKANIAKVDGATLTTKDDKNVAGNYTSEFTWTLYTAPKIDGDIAQIDRQTPAPAPEP
ncbi:WxL domain-containing protein [Vagococcus xieshaowenii]|nr:WxL domain-containing protein [Vagococcus xieshaowenii]